MKVVIDTNILLVSISPISKYRWIFDGFLKEDYTLCVTTDILMEYEEILGNHMSPEFATTILQIIENAPNVELITRYYHWNLITADADDNKFVDCTIAANAKFLVTHDKHFKILSKVEFPKVTVIDAEKFKVELSAKLDT